MDDREHVYDVDPSQNGLTGGEPGPEEQQWTQRGNEAAEQEDYAAAAEAFQQAVELNPNNARSRYNLALAQQFQGDTELAIAGWPVRLRETGCEPVPQSHATVNVALVYVAPRSEGDQGRIENAYERLCLPLCDVLREWGGVASVGEIDGAFCDGRYNVNLNGRKLVGTAQRWRQGLGGKRPVVLVHGALLLDNERESMVAAVNRFNECCDLDQRCRADSHIALHEVAPAAPWFERLSRAYEQVLAELPQD